MDQMTYIQTDNFPVVAYRVIGDEANDKVVVLLHGFPDDGQAWLETGRELAKDFLVLIPDMPGSGSSVLSSEEVSLEELGQGIAAILDSRNLSKAVIAGHSMGGYTSLALAANNPGKIKGLALVHSSAYADTEEKKETRRKSIALIRKGGKEPFIRQMIPGLFSEWTKNNRPALVEEKIRLGLQLRAESMISFYNAMINRPDRTETLENAAFPVQWIIGLDDNAVPAALSLQQTSLSDISFVSVYDQCGHMSMVERTGTLVADLKEFITYCYNQ